MRRRIVSGAGFLAVAGTALVMSQCGGTEQAPEEQPAEQPAPAPEPEPEPAPKKRPEGPLPGILMVQAQFTKDGGKPKPGPAKLVIYQTDGENWYDKVIEDPGSSVFHKAVWWRDGILTAAAGQTKTDPPKPAQLRHWRRTSPGKWEPTTLWEQVWEGKYQRLRDFEIGDLDGDGKEEIAIATHDMGVVAVAKHKGGDEWDVVELDEKADTFVHEVEIGDVDRDGKLEFYVTPSERNKASGESQPGGVARYDYVDGTYKRTMVADWQESHAKEILVADVNSDGHDELYVVKEGHVKKKGGKTKLVDPVKIIRMKYDGGKWTETVVVEIEDKQCRFLAAGDVNHDGETNLVAAGMDSGLWMLKLQEDGTFKSKLIDGKSGGFEHATHVADLNGDGKAEIYVASDKHRELNKYEWNGKSFDKELIAEIPEMHITWNLQDAKF